MSDTKLGAPYWLLFFAWVVSQSDSLATITTGEKVGVVLVVVSLSIEIFHHLRKQED
jgi:hypothetical protein